MSLGSNPTVPWSEWTKFVASHWLIFLDGASGSGKSSFKKLLLNDRDFNFSYAKRYTTRAPRADDLENDDYIFVTMEEFLRMQHQGDLVEYRHFEFGMSYGIGRSAIVSAGASSNSVLCVMNLGSVAAVKASIPNALCILIDVELSQIEVRLRERGLNSEEQIQERLSNAHDVKRIAGEYDFVFRNEQGRIENSYCELRSYLLSNRPSFAQT